MSQKHTTPAGTHDAQAAAELLGISKKALLKRMRELGWLRVGGDTHNLPHPEYVRKGYLTTQQRGYCLKGNKAIGKTYTVMLLNQQGYEELKKIMNTKPKPASNTAAPTAPAKKAAPSGTVHTQKVTHFDRNRAEAERRAAMQDLAAMGIGINHR